MLICLTASHKNADFDALEALATADAAALPTALAAHDRVDGAVVISTCNRFELYLEVDAEPELAPALARQAAADALAHHAPDAFGDGRDPVADALEPLADGDAAEHLFAVAAGLESVVVGEGEIAGQVRRALQASQRAGTTSAQLERLFQRASETQRGIKNRTGLGEAGRSIVRLGLDLASARVEWPGARVLLVGTGRFAAVSLAELRRRGAHAIEVWSPSGRGATFARKHGIPLVDGRDADLAIASADVVVTCTSADHHVVDAAVLRAGRMRLAATHAHPGAERVAATGGCPVSVEARSAHEGAHVQDLPPEPHGAQAHADAPAASGASGCPMHAVITREPACPVEHGRAAQVIVDMGLPRNVDPDVREVHGVELLDLETIRLHAPLEHLTAAEDARAIVRKAARRFERGTEERRVAPAIQALRQHVEDALDAELDRVAKRGTDEERRVAEAALRHFAGVLLHRPTVRARELAATGDHDAVLDAVTTLFGDDAATSA